MRDNFDLCFWPFEVFSTMVASPDLQIFVWVRSFVLTDEPRSFRRQQKPCGRVMHDVVRNGHLKRVSNLRLIM